MPSQDIGDLGSIAGLATFLSTMRARLLMAEWETLEAGALMKA